MKKIILAVICLMPFLTFSQINNLSDLLNISKADIYELIDYLQYEWELMEPEQEINAGLISETHKFIFNDESRNQKIERLIRKNYEVTRIITSTIFISNEEKLLNRILESLPYEGFQLEKEELNTKIFNDGNYTVVIQFKRIQEYGIELEEGFYRIIVYSNSQV